jgi:putative transposase
MRQTTFLKQLGYTQTATHGGAEAVGKRKSRRPLDSKYPVHLILKSKKAKGSLSLRAKRNLHWIWLLAHRKAEKFDVQLQGFANVGNHLHFKVKFKRREHFQKYLKSVSALIARHVTGARKGKAFGKFWDFLAYTKVVKIWTQEKRLNRYITANAIEGQHGKEWREKYLEGTRDG